MGQRVVNTVDGYYTDNLLPDTSVILNRKLGRMSQSYTCMRDQYLTGVFVFTSPDAVLETGSITFTLYRNGRGTGVITQLNTTYPKHRFLNLESSVKFNAGDYISISAVSSSDLFPVNKIDVNASLEFNNIQSEIEESNSCWVTVTAVDSGVVTIKNTLGVTLSNPAYVTRGDSLMLIASKTYSGSAYSFTIWTGCAVLDTGSLSGGVWQPSARYNDTCWIIADDYYIRARFQKTLGNKILFASNNTDSATSMLVPFYNGHDNTGADGWIGSEYTYVDGAMDWEAIYQYADANGIDIIVTNVHDPVNARDVAQKYYPVQLIMPSSGYSITDQIYDTNGDLPSIIFVGMTDTACYNRLWIGGLETFTPCQSLNGYNLLGYDAEFVTLNHNASVEPEGGSILSTVAYFAGLYFGNIHFNFDRYQEDGVVDSLTPFRDYWGARYLFRFDTDRMEVERTLTSENGYGYVDHTYVGESGYYTYIYNTTQYGNNPYYFRNRDPYLEK